MTSAIVLALYSDVVKVCSKGVPYLHAGLSCKSKEAPQPARKSSVPRLLQPGKFSSIAYATGVPQIPRPPLLLSLKVFIKSSMALRVEDSMVSSSGP